MKFTTEDIENKEPEIKLFLITKKGYIVLEGKDQTGMVKSIMKFKNGRFYRNVSAQLEGLETEDDGKIKEDK